MRVASCFDKSFARYGRVWNDVPSDLVRGIVDVMEAHPVPEGMGYVPDAPELWALPGAHQLASALFGENPVQLGFISGHNLRMNSLEYHRASEFNLPSRDVIMFLGTRDQLGPDFTMRTEDAVAYLVPANTMVELFAGTLHYAPMGDNPEGALTMLAALPKGTGLSDPADQPGYGDGRILFKNDKWVVTCEGTDDATAGAYVGLIGKNLGPEDLEH